MPGTIIGMMAGDRLDKVIHTSVNALNTSTLIVRENPKRRYLLIQNDSDEVVYLHQGGPALLHTGIRLEKNGGMIEMSHVHCSLCGGDVYAIQAKIQPKTILITEGE